MKFIFISIKIIFLYFISFSSSYSIEAPNIKNLIIYEEKQKIKFFDFLNKAGNKVNLKDFKSELIILNFWATWCAPCKKEMPSLEKLAQDLPQIDVYPINMEPPNKLRVRDWLQDIGVVSLNTYFDPKLDLAKKFKLIGMPTTVLLDKDGNEFGRIMGEFNFNEKAFIDLLNKKINL